MEQRPFGTTGLTVSTLGLGAGHIGGDDQSEDHVGWLLNEALDLGITLVDTARGYNLSEARIGRHLSWRRDDFVLSTKIGYSIPGHDDWSASIIGAGIDEALRTMRTDRLDIVHLHSCPIEILQRGEVTDALDRAVQSGKVRVMAYSGENEALAYAVDSGRFGSIQTSINLTDQRGLDGPVARAVAAGMGVIAKRPIANAAWRFAERPVGQYAEPYWERLQVMKLDPSELLADDPAAAKLSAADRWLSLALRFAASQPGVSSCIVGTASLDHLRHNADLLAAGPLAPTAVDAIRAAFRQHDKGWEGQV